MDGVCYANVVRNGLTFLLRNEIITGMAGEANNNWKTLPLLSLSDLSASIVFPEGMAFICF